MKLKKIFIVVLIILVCPLGLFAFEVDGIQVNTTTFIMLSAEPIEKSPAPGLITQGFGVSVPMTINSIFYLEPGIGFYTYNVILDDENRAVLANIETANRISIFNLEIRPEVGASFRVIESLKLGFSIAPLFSFKIPLTAHDYVDGTEARENVSSYFLSKGRFFSLYLAGILKWYATESITLVFKTGTNLPIYHFWDEEDIAFYNQLTIQPEIGFIIKF